MPTVKFTAGERSYQGKKHMCIVERTLDFYVYMLNNFIDMEDQFRKICIMDFFLQVCCILCGIVYLF